MNRARSEESASEKATETHCHRMVGKEDECEFFQTNNVNTFSVTHFEFPFTLSAITNPFIPFPPEFGSFSFRLNLQNAKNREKYE